MRAFTVEHGGFVEGVAAADGRPACEARRVGVKEYLWKYTTVRYSDVHVLGSEKLFCFQRALHATSGGKSTAYPRLQTSLPQHDLCRNRAHADGDNRRPPPPRSRLNCCAYQ